AGDFDPASGSPITWLATIARNLALDERRKAAGSREDFAQALRAPSRDDLSADQQCNEERRGLNAWLEGLAPERRQIVLLANHDGMTRRLDRPVATVKTWLRRSLSQLRECLGQ